MKQKKMVTERIESGNEPVKIRRIFQVVLVLMFIFSLNVLAQQNDDVKVLILSHDILDPPRKFSDLPPADLRINLRIKNDGKTDIYIFGRKYEDDFDLMYHLLRYDDLQGKWTVLSFNWELQPDDEKVSYRLKKGAYFDFYSITSRGRKETKRKVAAYYAYKKKDKPILIESNEFLVDAVNSPKN